MLYHNVPRITEITDHLATLSPSAKCQENPPSIVTTTNTFINFGDVGGSPLVDKVGTTNKNIEFVECLHHSVFLLFSLNNNSLR